MDNNLLSHHYFIYKGTHQKKQRKKQRNDVKVHFFLLIKNNIKIMTIKLQGENRMRNKLIVNAYEYYL